MQTVYNNSNENKLKTCVEFTEDWKKKSEALLAYFVTEIIY